MSDPVYTWRHRTADGEVIGEIRRYGKEGKKQDIPCYTPDGSGGFKPGIPAPLKPYPLFGMQSIKDFDKMIYVVEGQKCQRAMSTLGLQCVTSILGARSAEQSDWSPLAKAKKIILLPDNDEAGEDYMRTVYRIVRQLNTDIKIKLFRFGEQNHD